MKQRKSMIVAAVLCLNLFSCGNRENQNKNGNDINIDAVINSRSKDANAKGGNKCLLSYQSKYDELLTQEMALNTTGFPEKKLKVKYSKVLNNTEHHSIAYYFDMGRVQSNPAVNMPAMAMPDQVVLKDIKPISLHAFENSYRAMTDEEMRAANDAINDIAEGNSGDADADEALKKAKEHNVGKDQIRKTGGVLTGAFKKIAQAYIVVKSLGDAARWNTITRELIVLQNGVQFALGVNIADDNEKNKAAAIRLAKQILEQCE